MNMGLLTCELNHLQNLSIHSKLLCHRHRMGYTLVYYRQVPVL